MATTTRPETVAWSFSRGFLPDLPPRDLVPAEAQEAFDVAVRAQTEVAKNRARINALPGAVRQAKAEHQEATGAAIRAGNTPPAAKAVEKLEAEHRSRLANQDTLFQTARESYMLFGSVALPFMEQAGDNAQAKLGSDTANIATVVATLRALIEAVQTDLGVVNLAANFRQNPRYAPAPLATLVASLATIENEVAKLVTASEDTP